MVTRSNQGLRQEKRYNLMLLEYVERDCSLPSYQISAQYLQPVLRYRKICVFYTIYGKAAILDGNHTNTWSDHLPILVRFHVRFGGVPSNPSRVIVPTTLLLGIVLFIAMVTHGNTR